MSKQSSIEWFWFETFEEDSIRNCFPPSKLKEIKEKYQQAKQMHKEEIESAYCDGGKDVRDKTYKGMHEYYQETYGGNNDSNR